MSYLPLVSNVQMRFIKPLFSTFCYMNKAVYFDTCLCPVIPLSRTRNLEKLTKAN